MCIDRLIRVRLVRLDKGAYYYFNICMLNRRRFDDLNFNDLIKCLIRFRQTILIKIDHFR